MALAPKGFILSGGPNSVYDEGAPTLPDYLLETQMPVLGICYGMQVLTHRLGGKVVPGTAREYGPADIHVVDSAAPGVRWAIGLTRGVDEPRRPRRSASRRVPRAGPQRERHRRRDVR